MSDETAAGDLSEHPDYDTTEPITVSVVFQMSPLWRPGQPGAAFRGDLKHFAEGLCHWVAAPVAGFADMRGGDAFVMVALKQGDRSAAFEYRDGHYHEMTASKDQASANAEPGTGDDPASPVSSLP